MSNTTKRVAWNKGLKGIQPWHNISGFKPGWNKGMTNMFSKEAIESNIAKHLGKSPANKGKKMSEEQKEKLSKIKTGKTGILSNAWKGGLTSKNTLIRSSLEGKLWKKSVFTRDNFTCQKTGQRGGKLEAHHINNFSEFVELRFAIDNGITLSESAHKEFHKIYGKKNNTKAQIDEFLSVAQEA